MESKFAEILRSVTKSDNKTFNSHYNSLCLASRLLNILNQLID